MFNELVSHRAIRGFPQLLDQYLNFHAQRLQPPLLSLYVRFTVFIVLFRVVRLLPSLAISLGLPAGGQPLGQGIWLFLWDVRR